MHLMTTTAAARRRRAPCASFVDGREFVSLLFLLAVYALAATSQAGELIVAVNVTGSCALILIMLYGCWRKLQQAPVAIWTPLVWFRVVFRAWPARSLRRQRRDSRVDERGLRLQ
jgi:hypothetical protein